ACDDRVLADGALATDYAGDLLALIVRYGFVDGRLPALSFAQASSIEGRLIALLDRSADRRRLSRGAIALATGITAAVIVPLGAIRVADARPVASNAVVRVSPLIPVSASAAVAPRPVRVATRARGKSSVIASEQPDTRDLFDGCSQTIATHS